MQPTNRSSRILLPVKLWFVYLTLFAALGLEYIPSGRTPGLPDWVALVLAFWCVREPLAIGMGVGFVERHANHVQRQTRIGHGLETGFGRRPIAKDECGEARGAHLAHQPVGAASAGAAAVACTGIRRIGSHSAGHHPPPPTRCPVAGSSAAGSRRS